MTETWVNECCVHTMMFVIQSRLVTLVTTPSNLDGLTPTLKMKTSHGQVGPYIWTGQFIPHRGFLSPNPGTSCLIRYLFELEFYCLSDSYIIGLWEINEKLWGRNIRCIIHTSCKHLDYLSEGKLLLYFSSGRQSFSWHGDRLITFNHNMIYESRNILPVVTYLKSPLTLTVMFFI